MLGKHYLCAVVTQEESNGHRAQGASSNGGSRRESSWMTHQVKYWPTPKQQEDGRSLDAWKKHQTENKRNGSVGGPPGATLNIAIQQWATARGYQQAGPDQNRINRPNSGGDDLVTQIAKVQRNMTAKLNPRWVETLMGLPIGWTMPSCIRPVTIEPTSCNYSETALCRPSQSGRSES